MDQRLQIVQLNQEIIHSQRDEPLPEFPNMPVFPHVPIPYASLTPAELATFGINPARAHSNDDGDEEEATNDEEEIENDE
jgi:hypothetical protein